MRHPRAATGAELQAEAFGFRKIVALHFAFARFPAKRLRLDEAVRRMCRARRFAAARAMAIHEALERQLNLICDLFAQTASRSLHGKSPECSTVVRRCR